MMLKTDDYVLSFNDGGVEIQKENALLYYNRRPMYVFVKTAFSVTEFYDAAYEKVNAVSERVVEAIGTLKTPTGSAFAFTDTYEQTDDGIKIARTVSVLKTVDDQGFATKIAFVMAASDNIRDYDCFSPANWYKDNEYAAPYVVGYDKDCEYFWKRETCFTLPLFAAQNRASGESIMLSRWAADVTPRGYDYYELEHFVDPQYTVGSIGLSKPENKTINYLYYGFPLRKEIDTVADGLTIDYVYPGADGQFAGKQQIFNVDYMMRTKSLNRAFHPVVAGFSHSYAIALNVNSFDGFYPMMRSSWRSAYRRLRDRLFDVDHELHYHNCMQSLTKLTRRYGDSWGLPFCSYLPRLDISSVSFQFGFVGQQPGIGYQLIRYGDKENVKESFDKGNAIIDFWVETARTDIGAPNVCYNPTLKGFEPYPFWIRMIADGLENILDAYVYMKKKCLDRPAWLAFCVSAADWLVAVQNADGSFYRAYNTDDGSMRMDSKANTISIVRFLVQLYLVTDNDLYREAALKAGEWSYDNVYLNMEYRGSTCDSADIMDNESGIYAMFGFLSLYDLTGEDKWLGALTGAADYTETWTYAWSFPVRVAFPNHPFTKNAISGQSPVTIGDGGGDMYMAACAYIYYRLYVTTGDAHYLDFAEFIHNNTRQANDIDGSFGYALPGLSHEGGGFADQQLHTQYHWLPWVTYVEMDPTSRLLDTFGACDIAGAQRLSQQEKLRRNRIYDSYASF